MGVSAAVITFVILAITYGISRSFGSKRKRKQKVIQNGCLEPARYPHKDPIFGLDLFLDSVKNRRKGRMLTALTDRFVKFGTTFTGSFLEKTAVYTVDPKNLQAIFGTQFENFGVQPIRRDGALPFLGEGIFSMDGPYWRHSRDLMKPTFNRKNVASLPDFEIHFQKFLALLPMDGSTIDLKPLLYRLFSDTSTEFLFGESMDSLSEYSSTKTTEFLDAYHYCQRVMSFRGILGKFMFLWRDSKWERSVKITHAFAEKYVDDALASRKEYLATRTKEMTIPNSDEDTGSDGDTPKRYILLQEMAKETSDRDELRNQILHVFLAGHESTSIVVGNAVFLLARHPDIYSKLRSSVLVHNWPASSLTFDRLKSLTYLQHVIKETIRLYPVAPLDIRMTLKDTVLPTGGGPNGTGPIFIQEGDILTTSTYALHRLSPCFSNDPNGYPAEEFCPDRWENVRPGWAYMPFGGGLRTCPGQQLALTEAAYVLFRMCQEFERVENRDPVVEWVEELRITASSANGVKVGLVRA